jgi:hypothetical protein
VIIPLVDWLQHRDVRSNTEMLVIWQEKGAPDLRKFIAKCAFICMLLLSFVYVGFVLQAPRFRQVRLL